MNRKVLSIPVLLYTLTHQGLVAAKNICNNEAAENPTKISRTQIKDGLQHTCMKCLHCSQKTNIKMFGCIGNIILEFKSISILMKWISSHFC